MQGESVDDLLLTQIWDIIESFAPPHVHHCRLCQGIHCLIISLLVYCKCQHLELNSFSEFPDIPQRGG